MHFKNDILWIFSATNPEIIPSYVVGGIKQDVETDSFKGFKL